MAESGVMGDEWEQRGFDRKERPLRALAFFAAHSSLLRWVGTVLVNGEIDSML